MNTEIDLKKRYWVFSCAPFGSAGGLDDVVLTTNNRNEAIAFASKDIYYTCFDSDIEVRDYISE